MKVLTIDIGNTAIKRQIKGQGLMASVLTVGNVIGSLQGGFTFDALGKRG